MLPLFSAEAMRAVDRRAITELGIPGPTLMENAGAGAARALLAAFPNVIRARRPVVIVCGKGGNAGDGFVVARHLRRAGVRVDVLLTTAADEIAGDAGQKLRELKRAGVRPQRIDDASAATRRLAGAEIIVDALLGTGTRGAPTGLTARMIEAVNAAGRPVVALDIPSGLPADGEPASWPAVQAALTTTFAGLKHGLVSGPGADRAGRVVIVPIGVSPAEVARNVDTFVLEWSDVAPHFPPRPHASHKGDWGRLLIVAGSLGKTGAAALAARAAMRSGCGLVTVASPASQQPIVAALVLEPMTEAVPETAAGTIGTKALERLRTLAGARDAIAVGPGLGMDAETTTVVRALTRDLEQPAVLDADALNALAGGLDALGAAKAARCLTPHPGEMARLLGGTIQDVQRDRIGTARDFARTHGVHLLLKGAASVVATPDGVVTLNPTGNPGLASGGTGDVLTGIVGAFLARGLDPGAALRAGAYLHGSAADVAADRVGEEAMIASDVIEALGAAFLGLTQPPASSRISMLA
ncbi:MAG: NAD(P)H-hydrate dehydratase [Candidatus Rokubacteria bacterium]|nr:NAD(P)H-hydrate dehydratase [Candidatus Rokubacteria bacterium]